MQLCQSEAFRVLDNNDRSVRDIHANLNNRGRDKDVSLILSECFNSFLNFFPTVAVILNVHADHLDFFKDLADIEHSFHDFAALVPERGFIIANHWDLFPEFIKEVGPMVADGSIAVKEDITDGLENAPQAFIAMLTGGNTGKAIVKIK